MLGLGPLHGLPDRDHHRVSEAVGVLIRPEREMAETLELATKL